MGNADFAARERATLGQAEALDVASPGTDVSLAIRQRRAIAPAIADLAFGSRWQALRKFTAHPGVYNESGDMIAAGLTADEAALLHTIGPDVSYVRPGIDTSPRYADPVRHIGAYVSYTVSREASPLPTLSSYWDRPSAFERHVLPSLTAQLTEHMRADGLREVGLRVEVISLHAPINERVGYLEEHPERPPLIRRVRSLHDVVQTHDRPADIAAQMVWFSDSGRPIGEIALPPRIQQAATDETRWAYADLASKHPRKAASIYPAIFVHELRSPRRHGASSGQPYPLNHTFVLPRVLY